MFSDEQLLMLRIKERGMYVDERSKEKDHPTGVIKRKYKLFCSRLESLDIYLFFVADGGYFHCDLDLMVWVRTEEWEDRDTKYLNGVSYFDLRKSETLTATEITAKMRDVHNQFLLAARIPSTKLSEMKNLMQKYINRPNRFGPRKNKIPLIIEGLLKQDVSDALLKKLGLN